MITYWSSQTALGTAWVAWSGEGVCMLSIARDERAFVREVRDTFGEEPVPARPTAARARAVATSIERGDGGSVDWSRMPTFQRRVLAEVARIPPGVVRSYGDIADRIGAPRASRAVGTACARNPVPLMVPCHRVVRGDGSLGNYGLGGTATKRELLAREGYVSA